MIYLAAPYSHSDPAVRQARFEAANKAAAGLMRGGLFVFSPLSHSHPIALAGELPLEWDYWEEYDRLMLCRCTEIHILMIEGWQESKGIANEIHMAREMGMPVHYRESL